MAAVEDVGFNEDLTQHLRRRPDEVFEVRQREQLKKAAAALKKACQKIIAKAGDDREDDVTAGLHKPVARRFARLRASLAAAAANEPLVVSRTQSRPYVAKAVGGASGTSAKHDEIVEGSVKDLQRFCDLCTHLEHAGSEWAELGSSLPQEIIGFSSKHANELEDYARKLGKVVLPRPSSMDSAASLSSGSGVASPTGAEINGTLLGDLTTASSASGAQGPGSSSPFAGLSFLPPPPKPTNSVGTAKLI